MNFNFDYFINLLCECKHVRGKVQRCVCGGQRVSKVPPSSHLLFPVVSVTVLVCTWGLSGSSLATFWVLVQVLVCSYRSKAACLALVHRFEGSSAGWYGKYLLSHLNGSII